jgi:ADP-ribosylglycohydrolase
VSQAVLPDADVFQVVQAGLYGAEEGERIGREVSRIAAGPSVVRRLEMAVAIGLGQGTPEEKMSEIADRVGSGLHVSEAVPAAFGLLVANGGKAMATIIGGVNIGYDTDTVATMAGAMAGALQGAGVFPRHYPALLDQMNGINLAHLARGIEKIARERRPAKESG